MTITLLCKYLPLSQLMYLLPHLIFLTFILIFQCLQFLILNPPFGHIISSTLNTHDMTRLEVGSSKPKFFAFSFDDTKSFQNQRIIKMLLRSHNRNNACNLSLRHLFIMGKGNWLCFLMIRMLLVANECLGISLR